MDQRMCLSKIIQKFIAQSLSLVRPRHQSRNVDHIHGYEARPVHAFRVPGITQGIEFGMGTFRSNVGHSLVRIYGGEWIIGYFRIGQGGSVKECGLAHIGLSNDTYLHISNPPLVLTNIVPQESSLENPIPSKQRFPLNQGRNEMTEEIRSPIWRWKLSVRCVFSRAPESGSYPPRSWHFSPPV